MAIEMAVLTAIAFETIVLNKNFPGGKLLALIMVCTPFLSLVAHGLSANPLSIMTVGRKPRALIIWLGLRLTLALS
jgi:hypothetical protein